MKFELLVVTDHTTHSSSNSLYELSIALWRNDRQGNVWVCSRGMPENALFFSGKSVTHVYATRVNEHFSFDDDGVHFIEHAEWFSLADVDAILIRMPQPLDKAFMMSLTQIAPDKRIINDPAGTIETSSKEFLTTIPHLCPSPQMCYSLKEAIELSHQYEIVLKPMYSYGGKGIVRLSPMHFWMGSVRFDVDRVHELLPEVHFPMLAMRYLQNVSFGDKRTIVVNRKIIGSALRMPPPDSWICNIAQGGHAILSQVDEAEIRIEQELTPMLYQKGIIMYGFDTLLDDNGVRVLSEINTLSIGGLGPIEELSGKPLVKEAAGLLWDYLEETV